MTNLRRVGVVAWPIVAGALILASCGSESQAGGATASTVDLSLDSTAFIVKEPVVSTVPPVIDDASARSQEYVVQAGDYPIKVANDFGVPLEDLLNFNGWASVTEFSFPGQTILIPPGGTLVAPTPDPGSDVAGEPPVGETIPEVGGNCAEGSHTVVEGDLPIRLADQYDVTLASLDSANAGNSAYGRFAPGDTIIIPAKPDCTE